MHTPPLSLATHAEENAHNVVFGKEAWQLRHKPPVCKGHP